MRLWTKLSKFWQFEWNDQHFYICIWDRLAKFKEISLFLDVENIKLRFFFSNFAGYARIFNFTTPRQAMFTKSTVRTRTVPNILSGKTRIPVKAAGLRIRWQVSVVEPSLWRLRHIVSRSMQFKIFSVLRRVFFQRGLCRCVSVARCKTTDSALYRHLGTDWETIWKWVWCAMRRIWYLYRESWKMTYPGYHSLTK